MDFLSSLHLNGWQRHRQTNTPVTVQCYFKELKLTVARSAEASIIIMIRAIKIVKKSVLAPLIGDHNFSRNPVYISFVNKTHTDSVVSLIVFMFFFNTGYT